MRLAVVGTGLIGASAALAARRAGEADAVVGWDEDSEILAAAAERDAVEPAESLGTRFATPISPWSRSLLPGCPAS